MLKKLDRRLTLGALACAGIGLFGLCVFSMALMRPAAAQAPEPPEAPTTDVTTLNPRWLQLVREPAPKLGFAPAQAQSPQTLNVLLTDHTVAGRASNGSTVYISHTRGITLVASTSVRPMLDGGSFFYAALLPYTFICPPGQGCYSPDFEPGDVVQVSQGSSLLTTTIPTLSALAYSKDDAIRGDAPPSQTVSVAWYSAANPDLNVTRIVTADANGAYEASLVGVADVRARDSGFVLLATGANTTIAQQFVSPFLRAQVRGLQVSGLVLPNKAVSIQVTDATSNTRYSNSYSASDGTFNASFAYDGSGVLKPGDVVSAVVSTQPFSMTIEDIGASASYSQARVTGFAPTNRLVELEVIPGPVSDGFGYYTAYPATHTVAVTASATGQYTAAVVLQAAAYGSANVSDSDGHQSSARFVLPYVRARMGSAAFFSNSPADNSQLIGQLDTFGSPLTLSVQSQRGYIKDIRQAYVIANTGFFMLPTYYDESGSNFQALLGAGDVVTVASPLGVHLGFKLPSIAALADANTDVVTGTAPPNSVLRIVIGYGNQVPYPVDIVPTPTPPAALTSVPTAVPSVATATPFPLLSQPAAPPVNPPSTAIVASQWVTASADGLFTATFANLVDITGQMVGEVEWISPEGYAALQPFRVQGNCIPRLDVVNLSSSFFSTSQNANCPTYQIRLLGSAGDEKGSIYWQGNFWGKLFQLSILPGDTLELIGGGQTQRTRIPSLSVALDPVAETLSGKSLPNQEIEVTLNNIANYARYVYTGSAYFTASVGADGAFTRSLSGTLDIAPGTLAQIRVGELPTFIFEGAVPWMRVSLYQILVDVAISDSGTASVTMTSAGVTTPTEPVPLFWTPYSPSYQSFLPRAVVPGDQITIKSRQQTLSLTVPNLSAKLDVAKRTVTGMAPPNASLQVFIYPQDYAGGPYGTPSPIATQQVTATAAGAFTATFTGTGSLASNATLFYFAPNGSEVMLTFGTPRWFVTLGERYVSAQSVAGAGSMTLTLRSASGALKSRIPINSDNFGTLNAEFTEPVMGGDRIELVGSGETQLIVVPAYTATHDATRNILQGSVAPNALVQVTLQLNSAQGNYGYQATRRTQSDASGRFTLETADLLLRLMGMGQIIAADANGNTIRVTFVVTGRQRFLPVVFR